MIKMKFPSLYSFFKKHEYYFLILLLFISLFVLFFSIAKEGSRDFFPVSDDATLETRVVNASRDIQYLGPYSRFGWNHPGPLYFYILLPFYKSFSMGAQSLYVGAVFINIISVLVLLFFLYKSENHYFFFFTAFFFSLYIYGFLGLHVFRNIWNPHVTILPFAAFIFTSVHLSRGHLNVLPLSILFSSFVIQTHVAYAPAVGVIFLVSILLYILEKLREQKKIKSLFSRDVLKTIGISAGVFIVLWILPIIEVLKNPPGNLLKLIYYFFHSKVTHGISEAAAAVSNITNVPLIKFLNFLSPEMGLPSKSLLIMLFFLQLLLVIAAGIYLWAAKRKYQFNLLLFGLSGLIISVISVTKITGEIHGYLIQWMSVIGLINWCIILFTFFCLLSELLKRTHFYSKAEVFFHGIPMKYKKALVYSVIIIIAVILFIWQQKPVYFASQIKRSPTKYKHIGDISAAIRNYLDKNKISSFLLKPHHSHSLWTTEVGVVNQLFKSSVSFSLEDTWLFWFGYQFKQHKREKDIIFFKPEKKPSKVADNRILIHHEDGCSVYHQVKSPGSAKSAREVVREREKEP